MKHKHLDATDLRILSAVQSHGCLSKTPRLGRWALNPAAFTSIFGREMFALEDSHPFGARAVAVD